MTTNPRTSDMEALTQVLQLAANTRFTAAEQNLVREGMTRWAEQLGTAAGQAMRGIGAAVAQHYAPAIRLLSKLAADQAVLVDEDQADGDQDDEQPAERWIDDDDLTAAYAESGAEAVSDAEDGPRPDPHVAGLRGVLNLERARHGREVREARRQAARYWQQEARTAYRERDEVRAELAAATRVPTDLIEEALTAFCSASHIEASPAVRQGVAAVLGALAPTLSGRGYLEGAKFERDQARAERDEVLTLAEQALDGWAQTTGAVNPDTDLHRGWYERITRAADRLAELRAGTEEAGTSREPKMGDRVHVTPDPFDGRLVWVGAYGNTVVDDDGTEHTHAMRELTVLEPAAEEAQS